MEQIVESIINGQRNQAVTQMQRENVTFKELYNYLENAIGSGAGREIAILADMTVSKWS